MGESIEDWHKSREEQDMLGKGKVLSLPEEGIAVKEKISGGK